MDKLLSVPSELLVSIFKFVPASDLVSLAKTCRRFRDVVAIDQFWQNFCLQDYSVSSLDGWQLSSYRELYILVLRKFGCLLGLWKLDLHFYGGLLYVHIINGRIVAENCCVPYNHQVKSPLRLRPIFDMSIQNQCISAKCLAGWNKDHFGRVEVKKTEKRQAEHFSFICDKAENHNVRPKNYENGASMRKWFKEEYNNEDIILENPHFVHLILERYSAMHTMYKFPLRFTRMTIPSPSESGDSAPIPGIWKGTYSSHGIELILVCECNERVLGTKITGDPNIPAGELTFDVDLSETLDEEEENIPNVHAKHPRRHPFRLPPGYYYQEIDDPPTYYIRRCKGVGQIASHGFESPQWTETILYIINTFEFGLLWPKLRAFSMFSRVEEEFLQR